jgi:hypothetical protein
MNKELLKAQQNYQATKEKYIELLVIEGEKIAGKINFEKLLNLTINQEKVFMAGLALEDDAEPDMLSVLEILHQNTLSDEFYLKEAIRDLR